MFADIFSKFKGIEFPLINTLEKTDLTNIDVLFSCAPSGVFQISLINFQKY